MLRCKPSRKAIQYVRKFSRSAKSRSYTGTARGKAFRGNESTRERINAQHLKKEEPSWRHLQCRLRSVCVCVLLNSEFWMFRDIFRRMTFRLECADVSFQPHNRLSIRIQDRIVPRCASASQFLPTSQSRVLRCSADTLPLYFRSNESTNRDLQLKFHSDYWVFWMISSTLAETIKNLNFCKNL